jgi:hypothetical protein
MITFQDLKGSVKTKIQHLKGSNLCKSSGKPPTSAVFACYTQRMRRLGFFAVSVLILIGVNATTPAYAAFESAQTYVLKQYTEATFPNQYNQTQKTEFANDIQALKGILTNHSKAEPSNIGDSAFIARTLPDFRTYLRGRLDVASNPDIKKVLNDLDQLTYDVTTTASGVDQATLNALSGGTSFQNASQNQQQAQAALDKTKADGAPDPGKCYLSLTEGVDLLGCVDVFVTFIIKNTLLQIGGFLVWLTGNMLNYAIQASILNFSDWASSSLYPLWIVVRQLVSLVVVFAGLYLGFMYIIGKDEVFTKYLGWLVIFALFVNFSYPIVRVLTDISNIVSLNIYSSAIGPNALATKFSTAATTLGADTAGAQIMTKLGLQDLVGSATDIANKQKGFVGDINSMPGALVAVVFVFYAAYIFFMATAIIITRAVVLIFLIIASPLLLVDSVIPKLGDAAMKLRKMFFEQLVVAPVFMIMLALTLKFMDIFQKGGALKSASGASLSGGVDSVATFFSILMMLIMLHVMIKVTKYVAGEAGQAATNFMGKVGGFGLAAATAGTGVLARGSVGAAAARMRDSDWLKNAQDSRVGRGLYGLSNSLAQSTFDARNVGMVSRGMATAGLTGGLGLTMQKGLGQNYDQRFKAQNDDTRKKLGYINSAKEKEDGVGERYLKQMENRPAERAQKLFVSGVSRAMGIPAKDAKGTSRMSDAELISSRFKVDKKNALDKYKGIVDADKRQEFLDAQSDEIKDFIKNSTAQPAPTEPASTAKTKEPNLDTSGLDAAGFSNPNPSSTTNTSTAQESTRANSSSGGINSGPNGHTFNGTTYASYTDAAAARRKSKLNTNTAQAEPVAA